MVDDSPTALIVFCTCPDEASAAQLSETLVQQRLAACVNSIPGLRSTYLWDGAVQTDQEHLLMIKTSRRRYPALETAIRNTHPYELPEILAVEAALGLPDYLQWVHDACSP